MVYFMSDGSKSGGEGSDDADDVDNRQDCNNTTAHGALGVELDEGGLCCIAIGVVAVDAAVAEVLVSDVVGVMHCGVSLCVASIIAKQA